MRHLLSLNKYFWKHKWLFLLGIVFIVLSNYFRILSPQITRYVLNTVEASLKAPTPKVDNPAALSKERRQPNSAPPLNSPSGEAGKATTGSYDPLIQQLVISEFEKSSF